MFYKLNAEESSHMVRASQAGVRLINKEGQKLGGAKGGCQKLLSEFFLLRGFSPPLIPLAENHFAKNT